MNPCSDRDRTLLLDALLAARHAIDFATGLDHDAFSDDLLVQSAIAHQIQIIGEAARGVSDECRNEHAAIPWRAIIGMRHRIVHDYRNIDVEQVWETLIRDLPALVTQLEATLGSEDDEPGGS